MIIETERLYLTALTANQLSLWIEDLPTLEAELNCIYDSEAVDVVTSFVKPQIDIINKDKDNYLYHTFWFITRKEDRVVVGSCCLKGLPNENGEVEIGYGLGKSHEHNGYMTETVKAMCEWSLVQPIVSNVIAETECDGLASQRILQRCGFKQYKKGETLWWRLK